MRRRLLRCVPPLRLASRLDLSLAALLRRLRGLPLARSLAPALALPLALSLAVPLALASCATEPARRWAVEPCDPEAPVPPQVARECREDDRFVQYAKSVQQRVAENASDPWRDRGAALLRMEFGRGPQVRSICIASVEGEVSRYGLARAARQIRRLPVPRGLDCLEGHRVDVAYRDVSEPGAPALDAPPLDAPAPDAPVPDDAGAGEEAAPAPAD